MQERPISKPFTKTWQAGIKIHDKILGQSILGGDEFVEWVTEEFLKGEKDRERPSLKKIHTYKAKDAILKTLEKETGKSIKAIAKEKGIYRQIAMELLYRLGGLKGEEIGEIMGVGYTSVSRSAGGYLGDYLKTKSLRRFSIASCINVTNEDLTPFTL